MNNSQETNQVATELFIDTLSFATKSAKKSLLIFATLSFIVSTSKIESGDFQIPFLRTENITKEYIVFGLFLFLIYSLINFIINASADYFKFKHKKDVYTQTLSIKNYAENTPPNPQEEYLNQEFEDETGYKSYNIPPIATQIIFYSKLLIDFAIPILYGIFSLFLFIKKIIIPYFF